MGFVKTFLFFVIAALPLHLAVAEEAAKPQTESVCIACHRDLGGDLAAPVALWEKSIHHQMGNNCEGCHGGDPTDLATAMNPEKGFVGAPKPDQVAAFCGKCHVGVLENYKTSPHYAAESKGPNCVTCHHSHDVQRASFDLISPELCSKCHSYENGQKMKRSFVSAEMTLKETQEGLARLDHHGMSVKRLEEKLFALRNSLHQMTHTLDVKEIELKTQSVFGDIGEMRKEMDAAQERVHHRWKVGALVGAFLIALIFVLVQLHKSLEEEE